MQTPELERTNAVDALIEDRAEEQSFNYKGFHFALSAKPSSVDLYQPSVRLLSSKVDLEAQSLPHDAGPYGSMAEVLRHAEQRAALGS